MVVRIANTRSYGENVEIYELEHYSDPVSEQRIYDEGIVLLEQAAENPVLEPLKPAKTPLYLAAAVKTVSSQQ